MEIALSACENTLIVSNYPSVCNAGPCTAGIAGALESKFEPKEDVRARFERLP